MMAYICTKYHENILYGMKVIEWTLFSQQKISKGRNSIKNLGRDTVLFLCTSSDGGLISKGHNSVNNVGGVSVLVLCTSSDGGLYL